MNKQGKSGGWVLWFWLKELKLNSPFWIPLMDDAGGELWISRVKGVFEFCRFGSNSTTQWSVLDLFMLQVENFG